MPGQKTGQPVAAAAGIVVGAGPGVAGIARHGGADVLRVFLLAGDFVQELGGTDEDVARFGGNLRYSFE